MAMAITAEPAAVGIATGRWIRSSSSFVSPTMYWPARRDAADRAGQHVVEHEGRHRELGERPPHRLLDDAVDAATHEHGAGLDVDAAHGIREQHDRADVPGRGLADRLLDDAADVVHRRRHVAEDDRGGAPEGDEDE